MPSMLRCPCAQQPHGPDSLPRSSAENPGHTLLPLYGRSCEGSTRLPLLFLKICGHPGQGAEGQERQQPEPETGTERQYRDGESGPRRQRTGRQTRQSEQQRERGECASRPVPSRQQERGRTEKQRICEPRPDSCACGPPAVDQQRPPTQRRAFSELQRGQGQRRQPSQENDQGGQPVGAPHGCCRPAITAIG